ncbi:hypothetical protein H6758_03775 [Candidatus Nomurabacteria bacterium]|nr:hypothetical protein [Candidatus Nomurabacteria bacterium]
MKSRFFLCISFFILCWLAWPISSDASMTGGSFEIYADGFSMNDASSSTGGLLSLESTVGDSFATTTVGGAITLRGGFQAMERGILRLSLSSTTLDFGTLSTGSITTSTLVVTVSTDSETGYSLMLKEDGNLRSGVHDINDVADGSVTAGQEEYGVSVTSTDRAGTLPAGDRPIIAAGTTIAQSSGQVTDRQTTLTFRAAIDANVRGGLTYSHQVTLRATVNP